MEAMLGISLYSCLFLKLAKTLSFLLSLVFSLTKLENKKWGCGVVGEVAQTMYTHVSKYKNDKIKK
jgi:hypothetical protein